MAGELGKDAPAGIRLVDEDDRYGVTRDGQVWSRAGVGRAAAAYGPWRPLQPNRLKSGHMQVWLGRKRCRYVHILVARAFLGPPPFEGAYVLHRDDNPAHNHADNLLWGTAGDNAADAERNGRMRGFRKHGDEMILAIYRRWRENRTQTQIAEEFGITQPAVSAILNGRTHKRLFALETLRGGPLRSATVGPVPGPNRRSYARTSVSDDPAEAHLPKRNRTRRAILSDEQVFALYSLYRSGHTLAALARTFDITNMTVRGLVTGQRKKNLHVREVTARGPLPPLPHQRRQMAATNAQVAFLLSTEGRDLLAQAARCGLTPEEVAAECHLPAELVRHAWPASAA